MNIYIIKMEVETLHTYIGIVSIMEETQLFLYIQTRIFKLSFSSNLYQILHVYTSIMLATSTYVEFLSKLKQ